MPKMPSLALLISGLWERPCPGSDQWKRFSYRESGYPFPDSLWTLSSPGAARATFCAPAAPTGCCSQSNNVAMRMLPERCNSCLCALDKKLEDSRTVLTTGPYTHRLWHISGTSCGEHIFVYENRLTEVNQSPGHTVCSRAACVSLLNLKDLRCLFRYLRYFLWIPWAEATLALFQRYNLYCPFC